MPCCPERLALKYVTLQGAFSDFERLVNGSDNRADISYWTRKPQSVPEVVFCGEQYVRPIDFTAQLSFDHASEDVPPQFINGAPVGGPKSVAHNVGTTEGALVLGGASVYAIKKPQDGYVVRFINGLGCLESLHVRTLPKKTVPINTEKYVISRQETFGKFSRGLAVKSGNREEWRMSSGPLDEAWASWYLHEFLMASQAWILVNDNWLPINILPEETTTGMNRTKADMLSVEFTIEFDMNGSPY